jgi:hypothetical protein
MNRSRTRDNLFGRADSGPLPRADAYVTTETIAWRRRLLSWLHEQRASSEPVFRCKASDSDIPLSEVIARRTDKWTA